MTAPTIERIATLRGPIYREHFAGRVTYFAVRQYRDTSRRSPVHFDSEEEARAWLRRA